MDLTFLVLELAGTLAFAASGAMTGMKKDMDLFGVCILGLTTAVGGGVLRDVLAGDTPYIFVKHVYASASLAGTLACVGLRSVWGELPAILGGTAVVIVIRLLSAYFHWNLPRTHS